MVEITPIDREILAEILLSEFTDYEIIMPDNEKHIIVLDRSPLPGQIYPFEKENFSEKLNEFIMAHTEYWSVEETEEYYIEGEIRALVSL